MKSDAVARIKENIKECCAWILYFDDSERSQYNWDVAKRRLLKALELIEKDAKNL